MYRNVEYIPKEGKIKLFTWDEDGNKIEKDYDYYPYYYIETAMDKCDGVSIFGSKLKKKVFNTDFDRRRSIKESNLIRVYGNLPHTQQFLIDKFWKVNKKPEFSRFDLHINMIDIEVYSPKEFPNPWEAKHPINIITVYNSLKKEFVTFGLQKDFDKSKLSDDNQKLYDQLSEEVKLIYIKCSSEKELLKEFMKYWVSDYPDIITGWNTPFDIPYLINRCEKVFDSRFSQLLSPMSMCYKITRKKKIGPQQSINVDDFKIRGITILDYQDVYAKFNVKPVPNMKLDTIGGIEVGHKKIKHGSANLAELSVNDWCSFVFYNIQDVNIIKKLEEKLKYLAVARMLSYMGLCSFEKSLDTLPIVNGYASVNAYEEGKIIPTFARKDDWQSFAGGFVADPVPGIYNNIVSFDLNSLYPNTMITLNTSPETKFGKIISEENGVCVIRDCGGKTYKLKSSDLDKFIKKNKLSKSMSGVLFTQNKKGIFAKLVEEVYNGRVNDKAKIKANKNKIKEIKDEDEIAKLEAENIQLDVFQHAKKIFINSCYGYAGNRYAPMSDIDIAESVTLTCQSVIKQSSEITKSIIEKIIKDKCDDCIRYNDTDSQYVEITSILDSMGLSLTDDSGKIDPKVLKIVDFIEKKINQEIKKWGESALNSIDCRFEFKVESICQYVMLLKSKHYVMYVINSEGFHIEDEEDRWKYKGVKLVSASMPEVLKPMVKNVVEKIIKTQDDELCNAEYIEIYEKFKKLSYDDIAVIGAVNKYTEYAKDCLDWQVAHKMPANYKGAYYYNKLLKELGIDHKYESIKDCDKVKMLYIQPNNKYNINVISYLDYYPSEFEKIFTVDKNKMFEKNVKDVLKTFYEGIGWHIHSPNKQYAVNILNAFS